MAIFAGCVFFLDPNARLGSPAAFPDEQQSQDFATTPAAEFTSKIEEQGGIVTPGTLLHSARYCARR